MNRVNLRWVILGLVILASAVSYVLRTNLSVVGDSMRTDLGLTEVQLGMVFSAFAIGYALFQFPGGLFGDRFGSRKALSIIAVLWGILTILTALVPDAESASVALILVMLVATRFLVGATHAPIFPIASGRVVSNWFPIGSWGLPNGLISTGLTLGAAATAPLLVWLMSLYGWRMTFFLTAPLAFGLAAVWWIVSRDHPKDHPNITEEELSLITHGKKEKPSKREKGGWKKLLADRNILLLTLSYFCMNYIFYLFFNWFFYYLVEVKAFGAEEAGFLMAALWIIGAIGATLGGFACDWLSRRIGMRWGAASLAGLGLLACGVFLVAGATSPDPYMAVILLCICFGCNQLTEASYWSTVIAVSGERAAEGSGIMNTGGNVVGFVGGMLVPVVAQSAGWTVAICTGAAFALVGALTWLFIRADGRIEGLDASHAA